MFDLHKIVSRFTNTRSGTEIPPLDGPFQPNDAIEEAAEVAKAPSADNLICVDGWFYYSAGQDIYRLSVATVSGGPEHVSREDAAVSCLAPMHGGGLAIGLAGMGVVFRGGTMDGQRIVETAGRKLISPTALLTSTKGRLIVANASTDHRPDQWTRDLLSKSQSGFIIEFDPEGRDGRLLAEGLGYAGGLSFGVSDDDVIVSESWRHRLLSISRSSGLKAGKSIVEELPGYPGRISPASDGGYWLALFALRAQLLEFVLTETEFRDRMMREIEPQYWIAPSLRRNDHHLCPLQQGAVKKQGIVKPWAPARSYGLVLKLDPQFRPKFSFHSRANGNRHGVSSLCETDGCLYLTSYGAGLLLRIPVPIREGEI